MTPIAKVAAKASGKKAKQPTKTPDRKLPRPVVWLLWFLGAALASVVVGFALGLARPRART